MDKLATCAHTSPNATQINSSVQGAIFSVLIPEEGISHCPLKMQNQETIAFN